jgi:excisionase family DNA binding protein
MATKLHSALDANLATYSLSQFAAIHGVSTATIRRAVDRGEIPTVPVGARKRIPRHHVEQSLGVSK